jgi:hypothetical protein
VSRVAETPEDVRLRAYNVGFGDCILVTVTYKDGSRRHVLVDAGSTKAAGTPMRETMTALATEVSDSGLAVVIVTHQHRDHISGFAVKPTRDGNPVGGLQPKLLIRPWMDRPDPPGVGAGSRRHAEMLQSIDRLVAATKALVPSRSPVAGLLAMQMADAVASGVLSRWSSTGTKTLYVKAGDAPSIRSYLPGATLDVLGPPTVESVPFLASYDRDDPEQFWVRYASPLDAIHKRVGWKLSDRELQLLAGPDGLGAAAWLARRLSEQQRNALLAVSRGFDSFLNNTSVIALLTIGQRTLLLCGDAQIENWAYALARADALTPGLRDRFERAEVAPPDPDGLAHKLAAIDLYKVGHHGSKNATPKTLFTLWDQRGAGRPPVVTVMSTITKFHGKRSNDAEVPRTTLVNALRDRTTAYSTHMLRQDDRTHWLDLRAPAVGAGRFSGRRGRLTVEP